MIKGSNIDMEQLSYDITLSDTQRAISVASTLALVRAYQGNLSSAIDTVLSLDPDIPEYSYVTLWEAEHVHSAQNILTGSRSHRYNGVAISDPAYPENVRIAADMWQAISECVFPRQLSTTAAYPNIEESNNSQLIVSLSKESMQVLSIACDLYSKIRLGRFDVLVDIASSMEGRDIDDEAKQKAKGELNQLSKMMFKHVSDNTVFSSENANIAYDMHSALKSSVEGIETPLLVSNHKVVQIREKESYNNETTFTP